MADLKVTMTEESAQLFAAVAKLVSKTKESRNEFGKSGKAATEATKKAAAAAREQAKAANDGKRLAGQLRKAQESVEQSYKRQLGLLQQAHAQGKITAGELKQGQKDLAAEMKKTQDQQNKTFGKKALSQLTSYAAGLLSVAGTINIIRQAMEFFNREREKATGSTDSLVDARRSLRQVSKGDFDQLEKR